MSLKLKEDKIMTEATKIGRAPMAINEEGEVVFVQRADKNGMIKEPKQGKKPTPLMLCNEISKMFGNAVRNSNDDQKIHGSYRDILFHLAREDGKSQLDLARLTHLKPPTISVALAKLEADGYITREVDPMDQRRARVYLTDKGRAIDEKAYAVICELDQKAINGLTKDEYKQLMVLLFKLRENIAEDGAKV